MQPILGRELVWWLQSLQWKSNFEFRSKLDFLSHCSSYTTPSFLPIPTALCSRTLLSLANSSQCLSYTTTFKREKKFFVKKKIIVQAFLTKGFFYVNLAHSRRSKIPAARSSSSGDGVVGEGRVRVDVSEQVRCCRILLVSLPSIF